MLNKQKGNMYGFVTHTWNPISGKCEHDCSYCYMKRFPQKPIELVEKTLNDNIGSGNYIFVGSSTDMFAENVPKEWIEKVLEKCRKYDNNKYLFQTKNPKRFNEFLNMFPEKTTLCITIETNRDCNENSKAPSTYLRFLDFTKVNFCNKMVTIEPIMDFDLDKFILILYFIKPFQVNMGADSGHNNLPEPPKEKIENLIMELSKFTEVYLKENLKRLRL